MELGPTVFTSLITEGQVILGVVDSSGPIPVPAPDVTLIGLVLLAGARLASRWRV